MSVRDIEQKLGTHVDLVTIEESPQGCIMIKPREYIKDKSKWTAINKLIREMGGKWISYVSIGKGKDSHWEIPFNVESHTEVKKGTPETDSFAHELISNGKPVEGYMLIYLRQIRDLLIDLQDKTG